MAAKKRKDDPMLVQDKAQNPYGYAVPDLREVRGELRYDPPEQTVVRSIRDDPLARLHHRGQISEGLYEGGRMLQRHFEASEVGRIGSSGDLKEPVDGGNKIPEVLTERQRRAFKVLGEVRLEVGRDGMDMLWLMLAQRKFPHEIARQMLTGTQRDTDTISKVLKMHLTTVAEYFKLA